MSEEQEPIQPDATTEHTDAGGTEQTKKSTLGFLKHHKFLLPVAAIVLVAASSVTTYMLVKKDKNTSNNNAQTTTNSNGKDKAVPDEKKIETTVRQSKFTWQNPTPIQALPIYEDLDGYYAKSLGGSESGQEGTYSAQHKYFLVGKGDDDSKAYITTSPAFAIGPENVLFVIEKDGKYTIYQQHSEGYFYADQDGQQATYHGPKVTSNTSVDASSIIADVERKVTITYKGQTLTTAGGFNTGISFLETKDPINAGKATYTKLGEIPEGTLYEFVQTSDPSYKITNFYLLYRNHTATSYIVSGELSKTKVDPITWKDGSKNTDDYASVGRGCGITGANEIALGVTKDMLEEIGKSDKGQSVYGFKATSAILVNKHYSEYSIEYQEGYYAEGDRNMTLEQFIARRPIYLVDDNLGRWLVFSNLRYVPQGGCAKPVVYLYPTETKQVDVSVDADVTVSDPLYGTRGWQGVTAQPSGILTYKGTTYESLFWEGYARGIYPEITEGTVVPRAAVVATWESQLKQLNLNDKEIRDFVAFWETRIPNTPYVRISWLGTNAMQQLAPLHVTGGVDTMIRAFLDMEGLDQPTTLPQQNLAGIARTGFTVVEWGGLVRDGSIPKLQ